MTEQLTLSEITVRVLFLTKQRRPYVHVHETYLQSCVKTIVSEMLRTQDVMCSRRKALPLHVSQPVLQQSWIVPGKLMKAQLTLRNLKLSWVNWLLAK